MRLRIANMNTYINSYIFPKEVHNNLFIQPHPINGFFLNVGFLQLNEQMDNQFIEIMAS